METPHSTTLARSTTGVAGFDMILGGGVPSSRIYLVLGEPGTGKTTLALQFLMEGVRCGEKVLFVTLSESAEELKATGETHGWDMEGVEIFELTAADQLVDLDLQQTIFPPSEVELTETTTALLETLERLRPSRIVFDTLSDLRMMAGAALTYRRQLLYLKQRLIEYQATVLLLEDDLVEGKDIQSVVHGVFMLENLAPEFGGERRRLRVVKLRGSKFVGGYHDIKIEHGGLHVYPRLVAADTRSPIISGTLTTGVGGLDRMLGGGYDRGSATLIMGPAGAGKSTLALHAISDAAEHGMRSAIYMFDERPHTMLQRARSLGVKFEEHLDKGLIHMQQVDPAELSPGEFYNSVCKAVESEGARLVVLDSLSGFLNAMPSERYLLLQLHELISYLGQRDVTSILVLGQMGSREGFQSPIDISYLADTVIQTSYYSNGNDTRTGILVYKRRAGEHDRAAHELVFASGGLRIDSTRELDPAALRRGITSLDGNMMVPK